MSANDPSPPPPSSPPDRHDDDEIFTPREEEKEVISLTPQEIADIEADILGLTEKYKGLDLALLNANDGPTTTASPAAEDVARTRLLSDLDDELDRIPDDASSKAAYRTAQRINPTLVDDTHKMAFLWREEYDAKRAAQRLVNYWDRRRNLFGPEKYHLPLTLKGALRDDAVALSRGVVRIVPKRDLSGRSILFMDPSRLDASLYTRESMLRALWYTMEVSCENEDVRRLGIVLISFPQNASFRHWDRPLMQSFLQLEMDYAPVRIRSIHYCHPPTFFHIVFPMIKYLIGKRLRTRLIVHSGSYEGVLRELALFQMPLDRVPSDMGGGVIFKDTERWMLDRMRSEEKEAGRTSHVDSGAKEGGPEEAAVFSSVCGANETLTSAAYDSVTMAVPQEENVLPANVWVPKLAEAEEERHLKRMQRRQQQEEERSQPQSSALPEWQVHSAAMMGLLGIEPSRKCGRKADPRMDRAVEEKMNDPNITLLEALERGGFVFPDVRKRMMTSKEYLDADGVSLYQRKNQLNRRIRKEKQRI